MPDESIDLILTDPPYNISQEGKAIYRDIKKYRWKRRTNIGLDFGEWDRKWKNDKEYFDWVALWFKECCRVLKEGAWIYIFFDKQKTGLFDLMLAPANNIKSRCIYVWAKTNPVPSFRKVNWNSATEHIWVGSKGKSKLKNFKHQKYMSNYFLSPNASAYKETEHPTEKPLKLMRHLIEVNSNPGDTIMDIFMGSGTTGVACKELGRNFIGIELSPKYCEIAERRIANTVTEMFV
ncbi:MAG: site-specific DNA-methyltransferase [Planctomycetota bacterium]|nr:site-specific DNA-methyltransferase [Planctomycetota bacterium]